MYTSAISKTMLLILCLVITVSAALPSDEKFKNLKVLPKNISKEALDKVMEDFEKALKVDCNYCHVKKAGTDDFEWASDKKPEKEMARHMMIMTNDINKKYFNFDNKQSSIQAVTCITCHRGNPRPEIDSIPLQEKGQ